MVTVAQHCEQAQRYWIAHFKLASMGSYMFCVLFRNKNNKTLVHLSLKTLFYAQDWMCFRVVPDSQPLSCTWISLRRKLGLQSSAAGRLTFEAAPPCSPLGPVVRTCDVTHSDIWLLTVPFISLQLHLIPAACLNVHLSLSLNFHGLTLGGPGLSISGSWPD